MFPLFSAQQTECGRQERVFHELERTPFEGNLNGFHSFPISSSAREPSQFGQACPQSASQVDGEVVVVLWLFPG